MRRASAVAAAGSLLMGALLLSGCEQPAVTPAAAEAPSFTPVLSVKELMEHIVDPIADWIFDAAVIDVSEKGPSRRFRSPMKTGRGRARRADPRRVRNLLKMPRTMVPPEMSR